MERFPFVLTEVKVRKGADIRGKKIEALSLQRLAVYVETKKELDKKLREIPGGNLELIDKLYNVFDELVADELSCANSFKSKLDGFEGNG